MTEKMEKEISGWYTRKEQTAEERAARLRVADEWYEKRTRLNYRTVPVEIPGKMMLALGEMALKRGVPFSAFIEAILDSYLKRAKVSWRAGKGRFPKATSNRNPRVGEG